MTDGASCLANAMLKVVYCDKFLIIFDMFVNITWN
jgi:hypothetical protein